MDMIERILVQFDKIRCIEVYPGGDVYLHEGNDCVELKWHQISEALSGGEESLWTLLEHWTKLWSICRTFSESKTLEQTSNSIKCEFCSF
jgi:hypothetical protein